LSTQNLLRGKFATYCGPAYFLIQDAAGDLWDIPIDSSSSSSRGVVDYKLSIARQLLLSTPSTERAIKRHSKLPTREITY